MKQRNDTEFDQNVSSSLGMSKSNYWRLHFHVIDVIK